MPNGFWYAGGDSHVLKSGVPSSAFSKGDLLMLTSTSSLSRVPSVATGTTDDVVGVALSDSIDSIGNEVPYLVPGPDTLFWARFLDNYGSDVTIGASADVFFSTSSGRYFLTTGSASSAKAVIVSGNGEPGPVDWSVQSKVLCRLIYHAGNLTL